MSSQTIDNFLSEQESKLAKIRDFYQEKINEGTCFSKSIAFEIEQQIKANMSLDAISNHWFK